MSSAKNAVLLSIILILSGVAFAGAPPLDAFQKLQKSSAEWRGHYQIDDPYTKITDNQGSGDAKLYGTRNFRLVLHGVYYRGGANNVYNRDTPRSNQNPLPTEGLKNLCSEGFASALYFYPNNFTSAPKITDCGNGASAQRLTYSQFTALDKKNQTPILEMIFKRIRGEIPGPIYGHCWNGWHASGLIAALALQQFCDWSHAEAAAYWKRNTDGNSAGYGSVLAQVQSFQKVTRLAISQQEKDLICPQK